MPRFDICALEGVLNHIKEDLMPNDEQYQKGPYRSRREWEDTLLHARTGIFLILNGLAANVKHTSLELLIAMVVVNCFWVLSSVQSWKVIRALITECTGDPDQTTVNKALGDGPLHHALRPTTIISLWLPILIYVGWLIRIRITNVKFTWWTVALVIFLPFAVLLFLHLVRKK